MDTIKHLGNICKINGAKVPATDCIIFGAPCQDLSVAGKRAGMRHGDLGDEETTRSGLFMEAVRIIKEMRKEDERNGRAGVDIRPRYGVYENVCGAFSSNKGEDFRIVLEELAKVADKDAVIPMPDTGKWTNHGCIMGDGWSIAWRVLDAQFWGVPQRRRRIALVADFGGQSAPEILFVRSCMSGHTEPSEPKRKEPPSDASRGIGADDSIGVITFEPGIAAREEGGKLVYALDRASFNQGENAQFDFEVSDKGVNSPIVAKGPSAVCYGIGAYDSNAWKSNNPNSGVYEADTSKTLDLNGGNPACNQGGIAVVQGYPEVSEGIVGTLDAHYSNFPGMRGGMERTMVAQAVDCRNCSEADINGALQSNSAHSLNGNNVIRTRYIVRRLTPLECERLQGYPDGWTDIGEWTDSNGKKRQTSDAARYKALGNSIALPPWKWVLKRICACYERDATMASLFDGLGGFPKIWEELNGKGSCLWASEVEDFCIAVTERRINNA